MSGGSGNMVNFVLELAWAGVWAGQYLNNNTKNIFQIKVAQFNKTFNSNWFSLLNF